MLLVGLGTCSVLSVRFVLYGRRRVSVSLGIIKLFKETSISCGARTLC